MKNIVCIVCPQGCRMTVDDSVKTNVTVSGNNCKRGEEYAKNEILAPVRVITSTVRISGGLHNRCPVKTDAPIPKDKIFGAMRLLDGVSLMSPVHEGQIVAEEICGTKSNFIATRDM